MRTALKLLLIEYFFGGEVIVYISYCFVFNKSKQIISFQYAVFTTKVYCKMFYINDSTECYISLKILFPKETDTSFTAIFLCKS